MGISHSKVSAMGQFDLELEAPEKRQSQVTESAVREEDVLMESVFHSMLTLERRRAERSRKPFVLMLLDANLENGTSEKLLCEAAKVVVISKRETDLAGWYKRNTILGIIFTEVNIQGENSVTEALRAKAEAAFVKHLGKERAAEIAISLHIFPENWDKDSSEWVEDSKLYPDLKRKVS
jgi:hypothetical protein